jgi:hypothetical protein
LTRIATPGHARTVNQLLDRYLDVVELEPTTRQGYVGKIDKPIRPVIGALQVGRLDAGTLNVSTPNYASAAGTATAAGTSSTAPPKPHAGDARRAPVPRCPRPASGAPLRASPADFRDPVT